MPCDTIQTVTVQEELKDVNADLLKAALESMGFNTATTKSGLLTFSGTNTETGNYHSGSYANNKLTMVQSPYAPKLNINQVKVAYSNQVVQKSAMSYGWKLTKTGKNTYTAQKG